METPKASTSSFVGPNINMDGQSWLVRIFKSLSEAMGKAFRDGFGACEPIGVQSGGDEQPLSKHQEHQGEHSHKSSDGVDAFRTNQNDSELRHSEHLEVELPNVAPGTTFIEDMDLTVNKDVARMVAQLSMSTQIYIVGAQVGYSVAAKYKHLLEVERGGSKSNKSELDTLEQNYRREIQALSTDASAALENQLIQSRKLLRRCLERLRASVEDETYNRIWIDKVIQECRGIYDSWDTEVVLPAVEDIN